MSGTVRSETARLATERQKSSVPSLKLSTLAHCKSNHDNHSNCTSTAYQPKPDTSGYTLPQMTSNEDITKPTDEDVTKPTNEDVTKAAEKEITKADILSTLGFLASAGIDATLVGGAALKIRSGRMPKDIDVVVRSEDLTRAIELKNKSLELRVCDIMIQEGGLSFEHILVDVMKLKDYTVRVASVESIFYTKLRKYWTRGDTDEDFEQAEWDLLDAEWLAACYKSMNLSRFHKLSGVEELSADHLNDIKVFLLSIDAEKYLSVFDL